jgi:tetratricopeptide (TPR) repeat protein
MRFRLGFVIFFTISSLPKLAAQNGLETYQKMAHKFCEQGNYTSAIEAYERLLFFGTDQQNKEIYLPLARAYSALGNYEKASVQYNNAYNNQIIDTIRYEILFESALNYLAVDDTIMAYNELLNIPETKISNRISDKLHLMMGTLDYKSGLYTSAKNHFLSITILNLSEKNTIQTFFNNTKKVNRRYNPTMVEWMSIIPGLGQAWCGYYKESANAFLISGAFIVLFADVTIKYTLLDGLMTVYPWFNRYYKGGIIKAYKLAEKKRETEKNKLYNSLLKTLPPIN